MLQRLAAASTGEKVALFTPHDEVKRTCYIIVGADKGLAGAFNSNINKAMVAVLKDKPRSASMLLVTGRKPAEYLKHLHIVPDQKWTGFSDKPQFTDAQQIAHVATEQFLAGEVDEVYIIYTKFKSALSQEVQTVKMLPISQQDGSEKPVRKKSISLRRMPIRSWNRFCPSIWTCLCTTACSSRRPASSGPV